METVPTTPQDVEEGVEVIHDDTMATTVQLSASTDSESEDNDPSVDTSSPDGLSANLARRMARHPWSFLVTSLCILLLFTAQTMLHGDFTLEASSKGWVTRGTTISDRQSASILARTYRGYLTQGGEDAWLDLTTNIQGSWDDSGESRRRHLRPLHSAKPRFNKTLAVTATKLRRSLEDSTASNFAGCDTDEYFSADLMKKTRLWPVWKHTNPDVSLLDADAIFDICQQESITQSVLEEHDLCLKCTEGCLPPFSIVLYARLLIPNGVDMSCVELRDEWGEHQASVQGQWLTCVDDIHAQGGFVDDADSLPESCPFGFSPHLVDTSFGDTGHLAWTSSIFMTDSTKEEELYKIHAHYGRGGDLVVGAYDTQKQHFNYRYQHEALQDDMILALLSALVIVVAMLIHTRSVFIAFVGFLQILLSFPLAYYYYKFIAGYSYFPVLNFIGVFVSFALGADDVFVAFDKMKNHRIDFPLKSTPEVAAVALPDAAQAMFLTSLTTSFGFLATMICPVAPIKLFALFVGILVAQVYLNCILLVFPALCIYDHARARVAKRARAKRRRVAVPSRTERDSLVRRVFSAYHNFLHQTRYMWLVAGISALVFAAICTTKLNAPESLDIRLLDSSHEFEQAHTWRQHLLYEQLATSSEYTSYVHWGIVPADTGDHDDPESFSRLVLDESFDPSSPEAQVFLLEFCNDFFNQSFARRVSKESLCAVENFNIWLQNQGVSETPSTLFSTTCQRAGGIPMPSESFHGCFTGWAMENAQTSVLSRGDFVTILNIPFKGSVGYTDGLDELSLEFDRIEEWMKTKMLGAPSGVNKAFFIGADYWFLDSYQAMVSTAYDATLISLATSTLVILLSSKSLTLTLFSVVSILYVLLSTTATMVALGWTMGFLECICISILIGISADFVTHFSNAYTNQTGFVDRSRRAKHTLVHMGPSVLASAATTGSAAVIMIFTEITFFQKFAHVLLITITHSTVAGLVVFMTLTECFGPRNPIEGFDRVRRVFST
eukprot:Nitzschia sp. Nitz4//scaffold24_size164493//31405//34493//NITZ4_002311-RA/size164493-snap-gene-0.1-mRNA-1//1//CDS//3329544063//7644//frame0